VKRFLCDECGHSLFFEDSQCTSCGRHLGYCAEAQKLVILPDEVARAQASFALPGMGEDRYFSCRNRIEHAACNWLVLAPPSPAPSARPPSARSPSARPPSARPPSARPPSARPPSARPPSARPPSDEPRQLLYCRSCELTELIPDLSNPSNLEAWIQVERAKRRLMYTLHALNLPISSRATDPQQGLAFRFLRGTKRQPVMTGHSAGVITLNVAEAHAAFRENTREKLGEAYRTVLGHLRHEIGHYYWDRLIGHAAALDTFRSLFGDERQDYEQAIQRHYGEGPSSDWADSFISAYATMHPWEDWAETWAHYLHMQDTLETAKSHGLVVRAPGRDGVRVAMDAIAFRDFDSLSEGWQAVTLTLNNMSRSMGLPDAYPFVVSRPVQDKLRFIHQLIHERPESPKSHRRTPASSRAPAPPGE